jgi:hypothetical protein
MKDRQKKGRQRRMKDRQKKGRQRRMKEGQKWSLLSHQGIRDLRMLEIYA